MSFKTKKTPLVILGSVGNCLDIVEAVHALTNSSKGCEFELKGFLDDDPSHHGMTIHGLPVLGPLSHAKRESGVKFINGIGSPRNFIKKETIINKTGLLLDDFVSLSHPSAVISPSAKIGLGTVILGNVTICSHAEIGSHTMILPNCIVGHDCVIGNYVTMGAGVIVSGAVQVAQNCYLGAGSVIRENLRIGEGSLLGMGAILVQDMSEFSVYVGNPAKPLIKDRESPLDTAL